MELVVSERVRTLLRTLRGEDRTRVEAWFDHLKHWEDDQFVRANSVSLTVNGEAIRMFRTSTDVRIFFTMNEQDHTITVLDIANKETIIGSGNIAGAHSP
jgi:mRNA-degrading endonuclease RelE of RelBE toxin-antitoxin system